MQKCPRKQHGGCWHRISHSGLTPICVAIAALTPIMAGAGESPFGSVNGDLGAEMVVAHGTRSELQRGFCPAVIPSFGDSLVIDKADLVLTVSTEYDPAEPLFIVAAPATVAIEGRSGSWSETWTPASGGFDVENLAMTPVSSTESEVEIRIDVTSIVKRWANGSTLNYGFVIKSLAEDKSTFQWIRDQRYGGDDAKLEILYSRNPFNAE